MNGLQHDVTQPGKGLFQSRFRQIMLSVKKTFNIINVDPFLGEFQMAVIQ